MEGITMATLNKKVELLFEVWVRDKEEGGDENGGIEMVCVNALCEREHGRHKDKKGRSVRLVYRHKGQGKAWFEMTNSAVKSSHSLSSSTLKT